MPRVLTSSEEQAVVVPVKQPQEHVNNLESRSNVITMAELSVWRMELQLFIRFFPVNNRAPFLLTPFFFAGATS